MRTGGSLYAAAVMMAALLASCAQNINSRYQIAENPLTTEVRDRTRTAKLYQDVDTILILDAFVDDESLRKAWAADDAHRRNLGPNEAKAAQENVMKDDGSKVNFIMALYTAKDEWNDLAKADSRWSVYLDTHKGPVRPASVSKITLDKFYLRDNLPFEPTFRRLYSVSFAKNAIGNAPYRLVMSGQLGETSLYWEK
ncbi:MAG: hypothetical protein HZB29_11475 [Nitrospinae bacterium]|nr:hypothetical protein [Nitrospinota bacterium]